MITASTIQAAQNGKKKHKRMTSSYSGVRAPIIEDEDIRKNCWSRAMPRIIACIAIWASVIAGAIEGHSNLAAVQLQQEVIRVCPDPVAAHMFRMNGSTIDIRAPLIGPREQSKICECYRLKGVSCPPARVGLFDSGAYCAECQDHEQRPLRPDIRRVITAKVADFETDHANTFYQWEQLGCGLGPAMHG